MLLQRVKCPTDVLHLVQVHLQALLICLLLDVIEENIYYVSCLLSFFELDFAWGEFQYVFCLPSVSCLFSIETIEQGRTSFSNEVFFLRRAVLAARIFIYIPEIPSSNKK